VTGPGARSESRATLDSPFGLLKKSETRVSKQKPLSEKVGTEKIDVALIHGRTEDGQGLRVIRRRDDRLELADVRPLEEGKPIHGEVVRLTPRPDFPLLCDIETEFSSPSMLSHKGPAQVATDSYRRNWEAIFQPAAEESAEPELLN
jgi:hypothetical protein